MGKRSKFLALILLAGCSNRTWPGIPHVETNDLPPGYSIQYQAETKHFTFCMPHYCPRFFHFTSQAQAIDWAWFQYSHDQDPPKPPDPDDDQSKWKTVKP